MRFEEQRVVVTGAGSGIGRATALLLRARGAEVLATDLRADRLSDVVAAGAAGVAADVSTAAGRATVIDAAGALTGLVNCAGLMVCEPLEAVEEASWDAVFGVNAKALFFLCQALVPRIPAGGSVVNLSSVAAKYSQTSEAAVYSASKAAVQSITRTFAAVHAPRGVRVNSVCPGVIDTPMQDLVVANAAAARGLDPAELRRNRLAAVPMGREGEPEECARAIAALLSDELSYVTGQAINVCGGFQMY